ncbi:hypothetical protein NDU88_003457 [Pleurodeles waltl]|uniref:Uncharacterized protein n=1 Tax=Pleurodeles waltl TaxID=8319 RepID=A0AAV7W687_PLEWA|nr:hypothetical protein NDU88_003457 [Pleurodeles waltl]
MADKGGAIVVQNTSDYKKEIVMQLADTGSYKKLERNPTSEVGDLIKRITGEDLEMGFLTDLEYEFLNKKNPRIAYCTPERPRAGPNQESATPVTWRGRGGNMTSGELKTPMPVEDRGSGEEEDKDGDVDESCLPRKTIEDEEGAAGERNTEAAPGGRAKDPDTLLEKRGTTREP